MDYVCIQCLHDGSNKARSSVTVTAVNAKNSKKMQVQWGAVLRPEWNARSEGHQC
jgi:hypothetical protein